jgi:phage protein U
MLFQLGSVTFEVAPVNVDATDLSMGSDYAAHEVIGAQKPRESTGQADTRLRLSGKLFPEKFGIGAWPSLQAMSVSGTPQMLIRGDGTVFGWQLIEKLNEKHTYLGVDGVGRVIEFDIEMVQSPDGASAGSMLNLLGDLISSFSGLFG